MTKHGNSVKLADHEQALFRAHGLVSDELMGDWRALALWIAAKPPAKPTAKGKRGRPQKSVSEKLFLLAFVKVLVGGGMSEEQAFLAIASETGSPLKGRKWHSLKRRYYEILKSLTPEYRQKVAHWKVVVDDFSPSSFQTVLRRILAETAVRKLR